MSEKGVYAVDRGIWTDPDFKNEPFTEREAFLWLVGEAAWRPTRTRVGSYTFELERGQCVFSTRFMAKRFQWSEARVRRFLERRSDLNQVCTKTDAGATQITICKYDVFQRVGLPSDAGATQHRRRSDAKKKHLNIETLKEEADASSTRARTPAPAQRKPFDEWWSRYPHKVGKRDAEKAYASAVKRGASPNDLAGGIDRYIATKPLDRPWCNPATWLNQDRWADEPASSPAASSTRGRNGLGEGQSAPSAAAPFGLAWGAARMASLLAGPTGPKPQLTKVERMLIERGEWTAEQVIADKRVRTGWPDVNAMHEQAEGQRGSHVAPRFAAMQDVMEAVPIGTPAFAAWQAHHAAMGWPWIPEPGGLREVWFPRGGPAGLAAFEAAVATEGAGR